MSTNWKKLDPTLMTTTFYSTLTAFALTSLAYFLACFVSVSIFMPLYSDFSVVLPSYVNLLFLPHGVRVLAVWLLGWRAIIYLFPTSYVCGQIFFVPTGLPLASLLGPMIGVFAAVLAFGAVRVLLPLVANESCRELDWKDLMLIGCLASIINTTIVASGTGNFSFDIVGIFFGDVTGMFVCLLILMIIFKVCSPRSNQKGPNGI